MRYRVRGANRDLGHEMSYTVDAPSRKHAAMIARGRGIVVSEVEPVDEPPITAPEVQPQAFASDGRQQGDPLPELARAVQAARAASRPGPPKRGREARRIERANASLLDSYIKVALAVVLTLVILAFIIFAVGVCSSVQQMSSFPK